MVRMCNRSDGVETYAPACLSSSPSTRLAFCFKTPDAIVASAKDSSSAVQQKIAPIPKKQLDEFLLEEASSMARKAEPEACRVNMRGLLDALTPWKQAKFIQSEVPKRYAQLMQQIDSLSDWRNVEEIVKVHKLLFDASCALRLVRRSRDTDLQEFTKCVQEAKTNFKPLTILITRGMQKLHQQSGGQHDHAFTDEWLNRFLLATISCEVLTSQYLACAKDASTGIVDLKCDATEICRRAVRQVGKLCEKETGKKPIWSIEKHTIGCLKSNESPVFTYIPQFLLYILTELLKNSFQATARHCDVNDLEMHPIHIIVSSDDDHVAFRISDCAGGIPFKVGERIWSYLYSTARGSSAFSGNGIGLPLSRLYAGYLGGKLELSTVPGYGTDVYLLLPRMRTDGSI